MRIARRSIRARSRRRQWRGHAETGRDVSRLRGGRCAGNRACHISCGEHDLHRPGSGTTCRTRSTESSFSRRSRLRSPLRCSARRLLADSVRSGSISAVWAAASSRWSSSSSVRPSSRTPRLPSRFCSSPPRSSARGSASRCPSLNTLTAAFHPTGVESSVLVLNALLGLGTTLAPVFVAIFVGLGFWWGLPLLSAILLAALVFASLGLPLRTEAGPQPPRDPQPQRASPAASGSTPGSPFCTACARP